VVFEVVRGHGKSERRDTQSEPKCGRCGNQHTAKSKCPATGKTCNYCHKHGHFVNMCCKILNREAGEVEQRSSDIEDVESRPFYICEVEAVSCHQCTNALRMNKKTENRNPKFKQHELDVLVEEIGENKAILFGSFSPMITKTLKNETWEAISTKISACSQMERSVKSLKKRCQDLA
jgi:hypothetical protein